MPEDKVLFRQDRDGVPVIGNALNVWGGVGDGYCADFLYLFVETSRLQFQYFALDLYGFSVFGFMVVPCRRT